MPTLSDLLAAPMTFEFRGQSYQVGKANLIQRARFGAWLADRAFAGMMRMTADMPDAVKLAAMSQVGQDAAAGVYDWGGAAAVKAVGQRTGGAHLLYILISDADPTATEEDALAVWDGMMDGLVAAALLEGAVSDPPA